MSVVDVIREGEKFFLKRRERLEKKYWGKYVAICGGQVIAAGDTLDEAIEQAKKVKPDKLKYFRAIGDAPVEGII